MRAFLGCVLGVLLGAAIAAAQGGGNGTIQGTVAGASVTATNVATGVQTNRKTNEAGFFVLSPLQPGEYTVAIQAEGFQTTTQQHMVVVALATVGLSPRLQLGTASQSVTVAASPPCLSWVPSSSFSTLF